MAPVFHPLWCLDAQRKGMVIEMDTQNQSLSPKERDRELLKALQKANRCTHRLRRNLARISPDEKGFQDGGLELARISNSVIVWARGLQISLPERFAGSGAGSLSKDEILSYLYAIEQREMFLIERLSRCLGNMPQTEQFKS